MVTVRPATAADFDTWLGMRVELWPEDSENEHRDEIERFFAGSFPRGPWSALLAEYEGRVVGFAEVSIRPYAEGCTTSRVGYLEGWFVAADARGLGVGRALVRAAEDWARARQCTEFASDADPDNATSIAAHLALGFDDAGLVRCFRKDLRRGSGGHRATMNVTLRPVVDADLEAFYEHQREPAANQMAAFPARNREAFFLHWRTKVLANDAAIVRAVVCDGDVAGNIACYEEAGRRLVGYWIGQRFWGRGVATAALSTFAAQIDIRPLHAFVATANLGSIRVLEKCGFIRVGQQQGNHGDDDVQVYVYELTT